MIFGALIPLVPPNPPLWFLLGAIARFRGQQQTGLSPTSHQIGGAPTSLILQRKDGTLIMNCPMCIRQDHMQPVLGFTIK